MTKNKLFLLREWVALLVEGRREPLDLPVPADVQDIHDHITGAGKELYIVGGAVRDVLLNKRPKDYDLATNATPDEVIRILNRHGRFKLDLQGKAFGVVRVFTPGGEEYEIATFRKDIGKGKQTEVEFTTIENDVNRRDLTMNALFYDLVTGEVVDYVGGIDDIRSGVAKAVGDPALRFAEDKLRMLRAARFAGRTGFDIDPETAEAIRADPGLRIGEGKIAGEERITEEFKKGIQSAQSPEDYLRLLFELGLLTQIFPGLALTPSTESPSDDPLTQVALLLQNNDVEDVAPVLRQMRYSKDEIKIAQFLLRFYHIDSTTAPGLKKFYDSHNIPDTYLYDFSDAVTHLSPRIAKLFVQFAALPPAASSQELMSQGITGPHLGQALAAAESAAYAELVGENLIRQFCKEILNEKL